MLNQEELAQRIANWIIKSQLQLATFLNARTAHFSRTQKEALLVAISIAFGVASLYLIFNAIK